jgi:hypothetical protein
MPNWLHRTTKILLRSVALVDLPEAEANYILQPDLTAVAGFPSQYWVITGDVITLMSESERDAVDAAARTKELDDIADEIEFPDTFIRGFALALLDELNILRAQTGLSARTIAQLKTAVRNKL